MLLAARALGLGATLTTRHLLYEKESEAALGLPPMVREALAFALIGDATLRGEPANVPSVTGARRAVVLGKACAAGVAVNSAESGAKALGAE